MNHDDILQTHLQTESKMDELKNVFQTLEMMNKKLIESERSKSHFLALVRNEFNNPLIGMGSLLKHLYHSLKSKGGEDFELFHLAYMDLLKLNFQLSNIVSAAEVETSIMEKNITFFNISAMLEDIDNALLFLLYNRAVKITKNVKCSVSIHNDRDKIYAILLNLLANAYEYTLIGSEISIEIFEDDKMLYIVIRNVGTDIKDKKSIFDPFYQQQMGFTRVHKGLGLGLSVTKAYIDFLGGKIFITRDNDANVFIAQLPIYNNDEQISFGEELDGLMFD
jgi:signal transduction histidine kinase